jgi:hypothetical protein
MPSFHSIWAILIASMISVVLTLPTKCRGQDLPRPYFQRVYKEKQVVPRGFAPQSLSPGRSTPLIGFSHGQSHSCRSRTDLRLSPKSTADHRGYCVHWSADAVFKAERAASILFGFWGQLVCRHKDVVKEVRPHFLSCQFYAYVQETSWPYSEYHSWLSFGSLRR